MTTLRRPALFAFAAVTSLALAACGGPEAPPPPQTNLEDTGPVINEPEVINEAPTPTPTPTESNATAPDPAEAKAVDQQMQEDADAVGMTARIDRSAEQPVDDKSAPAEEKK